MIHKLIISICIVLATTIQGYTQSFVDHFIAFNTLGDIRGDNYDQEEAQKHLKDFKVKLMQELTVNFNNALDDMKEIDSRLFIQRSADDRVISIDWDNMLGGSMRFYDGVYCVRSSAGRYIIHDKNPGCDPLISEYCNTPLVYGMHIVQTEQKQEVLVVFSKFILSNTLILHKLNTYTISEDGILAPHPMIVTGEKDARVAEAEFRVDASQVATDAGDGSVDMAYEPEAHTILVPRIENSILQKGYEKLLYDGRTFTLMRKSTDK